MTTILCNQTQVVHNPDIAPVIQAYTYPKPVLQLLLPKKAQVPNNRVLGPSGLHLPFDAAFGCEMLLSLDWSWNLGLGFRGLGVGVDGSSSRA